ncbi:MAG: HPr family phosphocarrier protein [Phycisphaerales bacterium]
MSNRVTAIVTISNRLGLHARPAMSFVEIAASKPCAIFVKKGDQQVDGKSIMQMMMLAATKGTQLEIIAEGEGCEDALAELKQLVDGKFGEE